jgi:hypothetical protein
MTNNKEIFFQSREKMTKKGQLHSAWPIYKHFEVVEEGERLYIHAPLQFPERPVGGYIQVGQPDLNRDRMYSPLQDIPDLFLRFTSLLPKAPVSKDRMLEIALNWARDYGVLGSHAQTDIGPADNPQTLDYSNQRDRVQSLVEFTRALQEAAHCLRLYEAATIYQQDPYSDALASVLTYSDRKNKSIEQQRDLAFVRAQLIVHAHIKDECYPVLSRTVARSPNEAYRPPQFFQGWGFHSLLGAMYLQIMWVMTAATAVRRCEEPSCFNIITFEDSRPPRESHKNARGKYRTRTDKRFCSKNCSQKWRYHNVLKPRHKAAKAETEH